MASVSVAPSFACYVLRILLKLSAKLHINLDIIILKNILKNHRRRHWFLLGAVKCWRKLSVNFFVKNVELGGLASSSSSVPAGSDTRSITRGSEHVRGSVGIRPTVWVTQQNSVLQRQTTHIWHSNYLITALHAVCWIEW